MFPSHSQLVELMTRLNCRISPALPVVLAKVISVPGATVIVVRCKLSRAEGGSYSTRAKGVSLLRLEWLRRSVRAHL